ncbi:MAG: glycogen/starch/alpha-glucan phosphorylase [Acetobacteraceae bacterium]|nr:glycogen/starch/alpha-glucan phosphorylase [Acetobacteraceae bacterium]
MPGEAAPGHSALAAAILAKLTYQLGKSRIGARDRDWFVATALAVRDQVIDRWVDATRATYRDGARQVYYLSLEFLVGRLLRENVFNLGLGQAVPAALAELGVDAEAVRVAEPDAALGNGGLGRLAACFMDSLASLGIPAFGYGIRYDHGLFRQVIRDGWQQEYPEHWLDFGNPWEFARPEIAHPIGFGGQVEGIVGEDGRMLQVWKPAETVEAVAYDTPVVGWRGRHVNTLRLWSARAADPLKLEAFNRGDYAGALADQLRAEAISKLLYPSDETAEGQELRLRQEYFFSAAALADLMRRHLRVYGTVHSLPERMAIQLNDTHPAIAVAELIRILVDLHGVGLEEAWRIARATISYTNHTLLPEALESWPVPLLERLLPRHMQIIYQLNKLHLDQVRADHPGDDALVRAVSLIEENQGRRVRMGHLAFVGSHTVNGVSALHSRLLGETVFRELHRLDPAKIVNRTNGISFRRWLFQCNPGLSALLAEASGGRVMDDPSALASALPLAGDAAFQQKFAAARRGAKQALARLVRDRVGIGIDADALFDVQIKRIHEYKRQLLNLLEAVALYERIRANPDAAMPPRVKIIAGKAAASYHRAKLIIKLAHDIARVVNADPLVGERLKLVFLPNYNVSLAEMIVPAADLSQQISTAGMEASGTGNMKLALNGALTIGTLDGANIEIAERVGRENIEIFGLTAAEVAARRAEGWRGSAAVAASPCLGDVLDAIESGAFSPDDRDRYRELVADLRGPDWFMVAADFDAFRDAQAAIDARWRDRHGWWRAAITNTAQMAWFSSDRAIGEYADGIWHVGSTL